MFKRTTAIILAFILMLSLLTACGENRTAGQILQDGLKKAGTAESRSMNGSIELNLNLDEQTLQAMPQEVAVGFYAFKNLKISYEGSITNKEPYTGEILLSTEIPYGDLKMRVDVPILLNYTTIWIKVPDLPFPQLQNIKGKYIEMDSNQFNQLAGINYSQDLNLAKDPNVLAHSVKTTNQLLYDEISPLFFKTYGEKYIKKGELKDIKIPENVKAKHLIQMTITQEQLDPFMTSLFTDFLPKAIDIMMSKEDYLKVMSFTKEMAEQEKKNLEKAKEEWDSTKGLIDQSVKNLTIQYNGIVDESGFLSHDLFTVAGDFNIPDLQAPLNMKITFQNTTSKYNEKQALKNTIPPASSEVIPLKDVLSSMGGGF